MPRRKLGTKQIETWAIGLGCMGLASATAQRSIRTVLLGYQSGRRARAPPSTPLGVCPFTNEELLGEGPSTVN